MVGDGYYQLSKFLPPGEYRMPLFFGVCNHVSIAANFNLGTHMTWGVNFGMDNVTNAVNMAKSIIKAFSTPAVQQAQVTLDLIEVGMSPDSAPSSICCNDVLNFRYAPGNEADLYKNNGLRPNNWTVQQYVQDWISIAGPVAQAAALSPQGVTLQGASFAGQGFTPTQIINLGILNSNPGKLITT